MNGKKRAGGLAIARKAAGGSWLSRDHPRDFGTIIG